VASGGSDCNDADASASDDCSAACGNRKLEPDNNEDCECGTAGVTSCTNCENCRLPAGLDCLPGSSCCDSSGGYDDGAVCSVIHSHSDEGYCIAGVCMPAEHCGLANRYFGGFSGNPCGTIDGGCTSSCERDAGACSLLSG